MSTLIDLISPWLGWLLGASGAILLAFLGMNKAKSDGKKEGIQQEQGRQAQAEVKARDTVDAVKQDVKSTPSTPAGRAERVERASRWEKR